LKFTTAAAAFQPSGDVSGCGAPRLEVARITATAACLYDAPDEPRTFGHVLVDEAQDISAMQWRMLARRCPTGSMTLVGDFGQASRPAALRDWEEVLAVLPDRGDTRVVTLTVNYRTPAEIMQVAHRVLAAAAPQVEPTEAVRRTGEEPRFISVDRSGLVAAVGREARDAASVGGTVAVIAPSGLHRELVADLADVGARAGTADALDARVAILAATDAKGLEFDFVIVVEPSRLVSSDAAGMRLLYMALTRATRQLVIVHAEALPEALASAALSGPPIAAS